MEWLLSAILLLAILPLLGVLAIAVKLTSPGPVLYVNERLGMGGRVFRLFKLRSMKVGAPAVLAPDGKVITGPNDARLTPLGPLLRLGFDELPQVLNVLRGDMCLIGPRPDVVWELERYSPRQRLRLCVRPGITGLTQILDGRALSNAENYELDVQYALRSSLWMDLKIMIATIPYALGAKQVGRMLFPRLLSTARAPHEATVPEVCLTDPGTGRQRS